MPDDIASRVVRGAKELVDEAQRVLSKKGPDEPIAYVETAYYLPTILGLTGQAVSKVRDLVRAMDYAQGLLEVNRASEAGMAALLAAEALEAVRGKTISAPIQDARLKTWGVQLANGRIPGFALILGGAKNPEVASYLVQELLRQNILCFLGGNAGGVSIAEQLRGSNVRQDTESRAVPLGTNSTCGVHAIGFVTRLAIAFGDFKPGMATQIVDFIKDRLPGFVLILGEVDDATYSVAAGAMSYGLTMITSMRNAPPPDESRARTGQFQHAAFEPLGQNDQARAESLVRKCCELRGIPWEAPMADLPIAYGPGFTDEVISDAELQTEFGGAGSPAFVLLQTASAAETTNGRVDLFGPDLGAMVPGEAHSLGLVARVAGPLMQPAFERLMERQIADYVNGASGVQQVGRGDDIRLRVSRSAAAGGLSLKSLGTIVCTRLREEFGSVAEKVQVAIVTDPEMQTEWLRRAEDVHDARERQAAGLTEADVDTFYACERCQCVEPTHVCIVTPERPGSCGTHDWEDLRAWQQIDPAGPSRAIKPGKLIDARKGSWEGINEYVRSQTQGAVSEVALHSVMDHPMTACACLECVVMLIPEANGVMVVSQDDDSMTPAGMDFLGLAAIAGNGQQTPGMMGVARSYLTSPKFMEGDGGFKRVVWMSAGLKEELADKLTGVCAREGDPQLLTKIADGREVHNVTGLLAWIRAHDHPAAQLEPILQTQ